MIAHCPGWSTDIYGIFRWAGSQKKFRVVGRSLIYAKTRHINDVSEKKLASRFYPIRHASFGELASVHCVGSPGLHVGSCPVIFSQKKFRVVGQTVICVILMISDFSKPTPHPLSHLTI